MAQATTAKYEELILEVEFVASSGTYTRVCGMTGITITRTNNVKTSEVPDCDDESKPHQMRRQVQSQEVTASGTGVWALEKHDEMMDWFYGASTLNVRLRNAKAEADGAIGVIYAESGPAILASLSNERAGDKGVITASIELQFDGTPTTAANA